MICQSALKLPEKLLRRQVYRMPLHTFSNDLPKLSALFSIQRPSGCACCFITIRPIEADQWLQITGAMSLLQADRQAGSSKSQVPTQPPGYLAGITAQRRQAIRPPAAVSVGFVRCRQIPAGRALASLPDTCLIRLLPAAEAGRVRMTAER